MQTANEPDQPGMSTLYTVYANSDDKLMIFFLNVFCVCACVCVLFFFRDWIWHFMLIVSWGDHLQETSIQIFWGKNIELPIGRIFYPVCPALTQYLCSKVVHFTLYSDRQAWAKCRPRSDTAQQYLNSLQYLPLSIFLDTLTGSNFGISMVRNYLFKYLG